MSKESLQQALEPMMSMINGLDLTSAYTAQEKLNDSFPVTELQEIKDLCIQGLNAGWLCPRTAPNLQYGRLIKSQKNGDVGIDTVYMPGTKKKCEGPGHEHPQGEVDLCFTTAGNALFDGNRCSIHFCFSLYGWGCGSSTGMFPLSSLALDSAGPLGQF